MGTTQGNSLCSYLLAKAPCFVIFYIFSSTKSENRSRSGGGRRMNIQQTMYTPVCKWKNDTC
jgi:hypothetical protein